ncbi:hypothetical protein B0T16DRAFT_422120 [Cercophora newfieldiana]|uniref:Uncharacterized protein n=1 Tax=Cercophora newfieldiana TaxID=92897 RepID=A0AA40CHS4_9PEZI|nr:hypothetical protein B0T16DRAFT_422120 [Cercophora newfieldiana]
MGLSNGYGVLIGTKTNYYRDNPDDFGRFYHGNLEVAADGKSFHCAIDVDPKNSPDGIQWRVTTLIVAPTPGTTSPPTTNAFSPILTLPNGWHALPSTPTSGALDYIRSSLLQPSSALRRIRIPIFGPWLFSGLRFLEYYLPPWLLFGPSWQSGTGVDALVALEGVLQDAERCFVFGEPYGNVTGGGSGRRGVHNVHQNQGDPVGGGHDAENAIWQDGATVVQKRDGSVVAFLNKFKTQAARTDDRGRPLP